MSYIIAIYLFSLSNPSWCRSLRATADKLGQETTRIGISLALFGIVLGGIYYILGKNDAGQKMTQALMGALVVVMGTSIVSFIQGLS